MAIMTHVLRRYACKIFSKITHQTALREARSNTGPFFFSEVGLTKFVLASELFVSRPYFICHLTAKRSTKISWFPLQFLFQRRWSKSELKTKKLKLHTFIVKFSKRGSWQEIS